MDHIKRTKGEVAFDIFNYFILALVTIMALYPVWYVVVSSFSNTHRLTAHSGVLFWPLDFTIEAYQHVMRNPNIISGYRNTMFLLVAGVSWSIFMTSLGAYFLSRRNVMWKNLIMFFIVFQMFFSGGMIPFFLTLQRLNLTNTLWGLIFPFSISTFNMIILRTGFQSIPESVEEAAIIDGAGHLRVLFVIIFPLSKAILAVMVLFYGVSIWNGWFWASLIIQNREMLPLQVILREILLTSGAIAGAGGAADDAEAIARSVRMATIVVATIPILTIYPFLQKHFARGVLIGAVKG